MIEIGPNLKELFGYIFLFLGFVLFMYFLFRHT